MNKFLALLLIPLFFLPELALAGDIFPSDISDLSISYLGRIFGVVPGVLEPNDANPMIGNIFCSLQWHCDDNWRDGLVDGGDHVCG